MSPNTRPLSPRSIHPGRRGEREKRASLEPDFGGKPFFKRLPLNFPGQPRARGRGLGRGISVLTKTQATCSSATRTLPLVSGLSDSAITTLTAADTVPTSIGMA
jgi:hypothetical protein